MRVRYRQFWSEKHITGLSNGLNCRGCRRPPSPRPLPPRPKSLQKQFEAGASFAPLPPNKPAIPSVSSWLSYCKNLHELNLNTTELRFPPIELIHTQRRGYRFFRSSISWRVKPSCKWLVRSGSSHLTLAPFCRSQCQFRAPWTQTLLRESFQAFLEIEWLSG